MKKVSIILVTILSACGGGGAASPDANAPNTCSAARAQLLGANDAVASGAVEVVDGAAGVIYVDATAGGAANAAMNPWTYVELGARAKAPLTDVSAAASKAWDLALKRSGLYTNGGDGGPGQGGAVLLAKDFDAVTAADATAATPAPEAFLDDACTPTLDETGAAKTSFAGWYGYDEATHMLTPAAGTWLVRGGTGKLYKVQVVTYYAAAGGGEGTGPGGNYRLKVGALD